MPPTKLPFFLMLMPVFFLSAGFSAEQLTISKAVAMALNHRPEMDIAEARLSEARETTAEATGRLGPHLSGRAYARHDYSDWPTGHDDNDVYGAALDLTQPVFDAGLIHGRRGAAAYEKALLHGFDRAKQTIIRDAAMAFLTLREAREAELIACENYGRMQQNAKDMRTRVEAGELTKTDLIQAEARMLSASAAWRDAVRETGSRTAVFEDAVGSPPPEELAMPVFCPDAQELPVTESGNSTKEKEGNVPMGVKPMEQDSRRADLLALEAELLAAGQELEAARAEHLPRLDASASVGRYWSFSGSGPDSPHDNRSVELSLSVPIYFHGEISARTRRAEARQRGAAARRRALELAIRREQKVTGLELTGAETVFVERRKALAAMESAFDAVREEFIAGTRTATHLLDAQDELALARLDCLRAQYAVMSARVERLFADGKLTPYSLERKP